MNGVRRWLASIIRPVLHRCGVRVLHAPAEPVSSLVLDAYEGIRLRPDWPAPIYRAALGEYLARLSRLHGFDGLIDVGAHEGAFFRLARQVGFEGQAYLIEANPARLAGLRESTEGAQAKVFACAAGAAAGLARLQCFQDDTFASIHQMRATAREEFRDYVHPTAVSEVPVRRLDEMIGQEIKSRGQKNLLLKTDTQGHDLEVLRGAGDILYVVKAVACEVSVIPLYEDAPGWLEMLRFLEEAGFVLGFICPIGHQKRDLAVIELDAVFVRPDVS